MHAYVSTLEGIKTIGMMQTLRNCKINYDIFKTSNYHQGWITMQCQ